MRLTRWDQKLTTKETDEIILETALWHCSQITESSIRDYIENSLRSRNFSLLVDYCINYDTISVSDATHCRQCLAFYSKRADIDLGVDRRAVAVSKFNSAEAKNRETNDIFKKWSAGNFQFTRRVESVLFQAQRKISAILGDVPSLSDLRLRFGPGATTQLKKMHASPRYKLGKGYACSEDLIGASREVIEEMQNWIPEGESERACLPVEIHFGKQTFVPKNAKADRSIVVEPMLNSMVQLGINDYLCFRLKRFGIDLTDQTRNQSLARLGSITGNLATLDLSSASDTIAIELVAHLLPLDWFLFLSQFRTGTILSEGQPRKLQMFSSMGNGFTFPLESLIFYALSISCIEKKSEREDVSVYGDDIIIPSSGYSLLCEVLNVCGFTLNAEKSYASGPFRESCGADYLSGIDIRPIYLKDALSGFDAFRLYNFYIRQGQPEPAELILACISESLRIWGPDGFGDGHLIGDHPRRTSDKHRQLGWSGYTFDSYVFSGRSSIKPCPGDRVLPSYSIYISGPQLGLPGLAVNPGVNDVNNYPRGFFRDLPYYNVIEKGFRYVRDRRKEFLLSVSLPGTKGYKRISIYTLD